MGWDTQRATLRRLRHTGGKNSSRNGATRTTSHYLFLSSWCNYHVAGPRPVPSTVGPRAVFTLQVTAAFKQNRLKLSETPRRSTDEDKRRRRPKSWAVFYCTLAANIMLASGLAGAISPAAACRPRHPRQPLSGKAVGGLFGLIWQVDTHFEGVHRVLVRRCSALVESESVMGSKRFVSRPY